MLMWFITKRAHKPPAPLLQRHRGRHSSAAPDSHYVEQQEGFLSESLNSGRRPKERRPAVRKNGSALAGDISDYLIAAAGARRDWPAGRRRESRPESDETLQRSLHKRCSDRSTSAQAKPRPLINTYFALSSRRPRNANTDVHRAPCYKISRGVSLGFARRIKQILLLRDDCKSKLTALIWRAAAALSSRREICPPGRGRG
ncbi:hypothetical protein EVAR_66727_1 [Eumeta japonica]|uniref:Uncharacterized protein n=1 Tax=Eumeta variegata TaxID=151549 RepID=A0A4C1ZTT4_EUMVA|nr:hypothetical protein EVAR_66727_1 [Eumeta japonica]